jgi:hypothetical protein
LGEQQHGTSALSYTSLCISPDRRQAINADTLLSTLLNYRRRIFRSDGSIVPVPNTDQIREALMFSRFRFKLIEFLKLPPDIREPAFRGVLERTSGGVCRNYLARAERVHKILRSEDADKMNATAFR